MAKLMGTLSFNQASAAEQQMFEKVLTLQTRISSIWIDPANISGITDVTFRLYMKLGIAGATYREIIAFNNSDAITHAFNLISAGVSLGNAGVFEADTSIKVTAQSFSGSGSGSVDIYYRMPYEEVAVKKFVSGAVFMSTSQTGTLTDAVYPAGEPTSPIRIDGGMTGHDTPRLDVAAQVCADNNLGEIRVSQIGPAGVPGVNLFATDDNQIDFLRIVGVTPSHHTGDIGAWYPSLGIEKKCRANIFENLRIQNFAETTIGEALWAHFLSCTIQSEIHPCGALIENCENNASIVFAVDNIEGCPDSTIKQTRFNYTGLESVAPCLDGFAMDSNQSFILRLDKCFGRVLIKRMTSSNCRIYISGFEGEIILDASNVNASTLVFIRGGSGKLTNNSAMTVVVDGFLQSANLEAFSDGLVYCDYTDGTIGGTGRKDSPTNTLALALAIANANKVKKVQINTIGAGDILTGVNTINGRHLIGIKTLSMSALVVDGSSYDAVIERFRIKLVNAWQEPLHRVEYRKCRIAHPFFADAASFADCIIEGGTTIKVVGGLAEYNPTFDDCTFLPTVTLDGTSFDAANILTLNRCRGKIILFGFTVAATINIYGFDGGHIVIDGSCNTNPIINIVGGGGKLQNFSANALNASGFIPDELASVIALVRKNVKNTKALKKIGADFYQVLLDDNDTDEVLRQKLLTFDLTTIGALTGTTKPSVRQKSSI